MSQKLPFVDDKTRICWCNRFCSQLYSCSPENAARGQRPSGCNGLKRCECRGVSYVTVVCNEINCLSKCIQTLCLRYSNIFKDYRSAVYQLHNFNLLCPGAAGCRRACRVPVSTNRAGRDVLYLRLSFKTISFVFCKF